MSEGLAYEFEKKFKHKIKLLNENLKLHNLGIIMENNRAIYYLVTKINHWDKPTYSDLFKTLVKLKNHLIMNDQYSISLPRLGCGLDKLNWAIVKEIIEYIFRNTKIHSMLCSYLYYQIVIHIKVCSKYNFTVNRLYFQIKNARGWLLIVCHLSLSSLFIGGRWLILNPMLFQLQSYSKWLVFSEIDEFARLIGQLNCYVANGVCCDPVVRKYLLNARRV
ncbi:hypothetical protein RI129_011698 [Pyrocoelia pectoralis]|uniref:Macro domain-containing protein n=1 Tax=Pyrocoelia pectoralis TaxID=417401 RepID=A0AAN7V555_9COLE